MKVTVILPVYNVENYLEECLESLVNQTIDDCEIIAINDGSTDNSRLILERYQSKYTNITVVNQKNSGVSKSRNVGIDLAKGEYLYFCDSDDYIEKNLIEVCYEICEREKLDILWFSASIIDYLNIEKGNKTIDTDMQQFIDSSKIYTGIEITSQVIRNSVLRSYMWNKIYKRSLFVDNNFKFNEDIVYEDVDLLLKILMKANRVKYIPQKLYTYRRRENSITTSEVSEKTINSLKYVLESKFEYCKEVLNQHEGNKELLLAMKKYICMRMELLTLAIFNFKGYINEEYWGYKFKKYFKYYFSIFESNYISEYIQINKIIKMCKRKNIKFEYLEKKIENILNEKYIELFKKLDLNNRDKLIGIYGIGNHTINLIKAYERYMGRVQAKIIFIDSSKSKNKCEEYLNRKVINVSNINRYNFDKVIISSFTYEKEIFLNLINHINYSTNIIRFYENEWIYIFDEEV